MDPPITVLSVRTQLKGILRPAFDIVSDVSLEYAIVVGQMVESISISFLYIFHTLQKGRHMESNTVHSNKRSKSRIGKPLAQAWEAGELVVWVWVEEQECYHRCYHRRQH